MFEAVDGTKVEYRCCIHDIPWPVLIGYMILCNSVHVRLNVSCPINRARYGQVRRLGGCAGEFVWKLERYDGPETPELEPINGDILPF